MNSPRARATWRLIAASVVFTATLGTPASARAQSVQVVRVVTDSAGSRLQVEGRDFLVKGMNWDYVPIGENYSYSLWSQPDDIIRAALDREFGLLRAMGVNVVRQYAGVPPRWVAYIYNTYGIWTAINHPLGRYGTTVGGAFTPNTDYSDPRARRALLAEVGTLADQFKGTPGVLMYIIGNENNYGLAWKSAATEALPAGERDAAKARYLYSLVGEAARLVHQRDPARPVALANGDLQYIDIIAAEAKGIDIFGSNVYRGASAGDFFQVVKTKLGIPAMFTEFGADAYNAREMREDQAMQARYLVAQWREIEEQTSGKGRVGNAIGGFVFQWSDGWWKVGQTVRLDVHDTDAGWPNAAYSDFTAGDNNMNEEWWGVVAKGTPDARGLFQLYPRAAYYALEQVFQFDPYAPGVTLATVDARFDAIDPALLALRARSDKGAQVSDEASRFRISGMRLYLATFTTGGTSLSTPSVAAPNPTAYPSARGFDHLESFFTDFEARPADNVLATLSLNILGHIPDNPIDQIFYENRGRVRNVQTADGQVVPLEGNERVKVYRASLQWDERDFGLAGFYRTGHYHWGYQGDFFGLYREANYGPNIDIYNGNAPIGVEFTGKRSLTGLSAAFGPELWWGANPALLVKYGRQVGPLRLTGVFQDDIGRVSSTSSSFAIPLPPTKTATLAAETMVGPLGVQVGGIWSGANKVGRPFQLVQGSPGNYRVLQDRIRDSDTFGAKAKVTFTSGRWNWYAQGAAMGLVADGGPTAVQTFTGWWLKDSGRGNQANVLSGLTYTFGNFQVGPNFLWQKPIVGPIPPDAPPPARPRNILDDPFAVLANREATAGEILLTYDPTPATWMYQWDNDAREDAPFAANIGYVHTHYPTSRDANIGILGDGRTLFAFPGAPPARDLDEVHGKVITRLRPDLRLVGNFFAGTGEPNGNDPRLIHRYGGDVRAVMRQVKVIATTKFNDWGPYDYHRDFNLTYPQQLIGDVSYVLGRAQWFDVPETRFGVRGTWRTLDRFTPRYCPARTADGTGSLVCDPTAPGPNGREWEIRSYVNIGW